MSKHLIRLSAFIALLALVSSAKAYSVTDVPGDLLPADAQTFDAVIDLTGNFTATGSGAAYDSKLKQVTPFIVIPPTSTGLPLSLFGGPISVSPNPTNTNGPVLWSLDEPNLKTLTDVKNLDVDLLNGQTADFGLNTVDIFTNSTVSLLKDITIDVNGTLKGLTFDQTGAAALVPTGVGTGTFAIPGDLGATVGNLQAVVLSILPVNVGNDQTLSVPFVLTGNYTVTPVLGGRHIALDGTVDLNLPLSLVTALQTSISSPAQLSISASVDLMASLTVAVGYHLETTVVPEPAAFVLLGIGLAALVPVIRMRKKK